MFKFNHFYKFSMNKKIILICGGSGMIGRAIAQTLNKQDYDIRILTRKKSISIPYDQYLWDPYAGSMEKGALDGVHGVINLAGASIGHKRWTKSVKKELEQSRISSTRFLIQQVNLCNNLPKVFISASAIGIYGDRPGEHIDESSTCHATDFLSSLCVDWESQLINLRREVRQVIIRIGLTLSLEDGILRESIKPAKAGLATIFGEGDQIYSWIHIKDLVNAFIWILQNDQATGIYNASSNEPVNQSTFAKRLSSRFHTWYLPLHIPLWIMQVVIGEFSRALYYSQSIRPRRFNDEGFTMHFNQLDMALNDLIK